MIVLIVKLNWSLVTDLDAEVLLEGKTVDVKCDSKPLCPHWFK